MLNNPLYYKNKINDGIYFDLLRDSIDDLLQKYKTNCVVILSSISDPDDCFKNKKYSNLLNVVKTKLLIDKIISRKIKIIRRKIYVPKVYVTEIRKKEKFSQLSEQKR